MMIADDPTVPPRYVIEDYRKAYVRVNRREPQCRYVGNHWYNVNGETVHRAELMCEIARLRDLGQRASFINTERSVVSLLIARLRAL